MDKTDGLTLTHEQVICVWIRSPNLEELHQVVKLTVNVSADSHRAFLFYALVTVTSCRRP